HRGRRRGARRDAGPPDRHRAMNGMSSGDLAHTGEPLLDAFLRDTLPQVKLELGRVIDRENARSLPERYAQLLPPTVLVVTLRPDAADSLLPVAREVESELTGSCMRHGSLYDREYRVQVHRAERDDAPLFVVTSHSENEMAEVEPVPITAPAPAPAPVFAPGMDPDATRVEVGGAPPGRRPGGSRGASCWWWRTWRGGRSRCSACRRPSPPWAGARTTRGCGAPCRSPRRRT
ncbi:MAG TPA: hypothetical protein VGV85_02585, partial [Longimicrobiaceae bacterium]|nr:hypothetical protein [Longimicrobiaceae bacterium]